MRESDIMYENKIAWVMRNKKQNCYTVFTRGITHSASDSAYHLTDDGLSIAIARAKYLEKRAAKNS